MADFLAPIKSAISSGDKAVSALQSGNQGYFADAVRDGLLALTALASVVSNNPLLRGTNALGSMYGLKKSADDLYAAGNLPEALRATAGALAAVGSLMAAFLAPQAKIVGAILAITFTAVKRGIEAYIATNDPTVLQSPTNAFPPYSQSEFYQFEVTPIDFFASISPATNTITGDQAQPDHFDVLYGSGAGDDITGLDGNDALNGGTGTDVMGGGVGDDLIGGGAGSDVIKGGAGNDWIFSALDLTARARTGPSDVWPPVGQPLPATATILSQGKTWGTYYNTVNGKSQTYVDGVGAGTADIAPDVIDGGDIAFNSARLWRNANQNAVSEAGNPTAPQKQESQMPYIPNSQKFESRCAKSNFSRRARRRQCRCDVRPIRTTSLPAISLKPRASRGWRDPVVFRAQHVYPQPQLQTATF